MYNKGLIIGIKRKMKQENKKSLKKHTNYNKEIITLHFETNF